MKKFHRIFDYIVSHWYMAFFIYALISFFATNYQANNDIWFILNNGRYVITKGIPHIDPFTMHEGLHYVMQQWLSSIIFYTIFSIFTKKGLFIFTLIFFLITFFIYYKLLLLVSNNKKTSVIITSIVLALTSDFFTTRPQIFTYIILILETYFIELYVKKDNNKYLYPLPILSLLLINLHASMWIFQFIFILPFIANAIYIKKLTIDRIKIKPILITIIIMILISLINPYGIESLKYIFTSYGLKEVNNMIAEMHMTTFENPLLYIMILFILIIFIIINYNKKARLDIRHICFIFGISLLTIMHNKCLIYFFIYAGYVISTLIPNIKIKPIKISKELRKVAKESIIPIITMLTIIAGTMFITSYRIYGLYKGLSNNIVEYIVDNYDKENTKVFINFSDGGHVEYEGLKAYIDSRAELFYKKNNKKKDIFKEYAKLYEHNDDKYYKDFINRYNFTHIIVINNNGLYNYLENNKTNYVLEYTEKEQTSIMKLYVRKNIKKQEKQKSI